MGITKFVFGFDKLDVTALQESQNIDAEQFKKVFGALKEWQEAQKIDAKQFEEVFSALKEWQEAQKIDAKQFEEVFSALKEWQEAQKIDAKQFEEVFSALKEWQEAQKIDAKQFEEVFSALKEKIGTEQFQGMQEHLNGLQEKVETLTEAVGEQEKTLLICTIATAVAVTAITCFVAFCIYQGVKLEKGGKNDLSQDKPDGKFNNVSDTERLKSNLQEGRV